ncbi:hypothetical protein Pmani_009536 [Petrolisthes manimaculis]|uniref:Alpha-1,3-mannosyl-glycoprotein 2-beta-N-acetylglucosaminyltransferase n=1 Tax=Petrolisthes manimaculis TaxID=1843537 RepID=A0AAE1UGM9_9EUCA|nr:hypothetical protein Pmani_009536 [Petrolisthes manimaculis]
MGTTDGGIIVVVVVGAGWRTFLTHQPGEHLALRDYIAAIQPGRVLLLAAMVSRYRFPSSQQPPFLTYLWPEGGEALEQLGATLLPRVAIGEPWAMVVVTGEPAGGKAKVLGEALVTKELNELGQNKNPSLNLEIPHSMLTGGWCGRREENMTSSKSVTSEQARFCDTYDGYGDLCDCHLPFLPPPYPVPAGFEMKEDIPVVVVTANKPHHLYRLLRNLLGLVEGAGETKLLVVVDGPHQETLDLARLFQVEVVVHAPQGPPGKNTRTNSNVAFALVSVFSRWPHVDKAILLEDDLLLASDLLRYFHHTAPALTLDPSLYLVSAWGQHSYHSTASDPSTVHRVQAYPQYGWMTTRAWVTYVLPHWAPNGSGVDWDWWVYSEGVNAGLEALVPEVSRTAHMGAAGAHVTGWEQHLFFSHRIMTDSFLKSSAHTLMPLHTLLGRNYSTWLDGELGIATKITLQDHPCHTHPVPPHMSGPFVLYLGVTSRSDDYSSFYLLQACLGTDDQEVKELYEGVMRLRVRPYSYSRTQAARTSLLAQAHHVLHYQGRGRREDKNNIQGEEEKEESQVLYLVGCPLSPYCRHSSGTSDWLLAGTPAILEEAMKVARRRRMAGIIPSHSCKYSHPSLDVTLCTIIKCHLTSDVTCCILQ